MKHTSAILISAAGAVRRAVRMLLPCLFGPLLLLWPLRATAQGGVGLPSMDIPRVVVLPFSVPADAEDLEGLAKALTRAVERDLRPMVEVATVRASVIGMPASGCLVDPACVSRVLSAGIADALIVGQVEVPGGPVAEPRVLVSVFAPAWKLSYAERWTAAAEAPVALAAKALLGMMQSRGRSATPPPAVVTSRSAEVGGFGRGEDGLRDDELEPEPDGWKEVRRARRKEKRAAQEARRAERVAKRARRKEARQEKRALGPAVAWPDPAEDPGFRGWSLEIGGGSASGAVDVAAASQVTSAENQYRWAVRENGQGWSGRIAVSRMLGTRFQLGLEVAGMTERGSLELYYQPEEDPAYDASHATWGVHLLAGVAWRWLPMTAGRFQPYLGAGAGLWFSPGFKGIDQEIAGPHESFGPYYRLQANGGFGLRVLVSSRTCVGLDFRGIVDPGAEFLEPVTNADVGLSIDQLASPPPPRRAVGLLSAGVGFLF